MTDWKPTVLTASAPSGEMTTWINPSAIEQLQREVDALKALSRPSPAAPNAQAEYEARHPEEPATPLGDAAWWRAQFEHEVHMRARLEEQLEAALARPAPPPEPEPEQDAKHEGGMATPHTCAYCDYYSERVPGCSGRCERFEGDADAFDTCSHWQAPSAPTPEPRLAYVPQGAPGTGAYIVEGEMLEALNALPKLRAENAELRARLELANKTKLQTMDDYHALQAEVAALRSLRDSVWSLGDTAQWRMRAEQRGYMVFCNAQDCADIADIQEELAALDAAEGEGR